MKKDKTRSLVKWKGYPESFNSWVDNQDLIKLWNKCQMILEFKAQQSLRFWTSSHQSKLKNYEKLWTLIQSCIEKFSSFDVNFGPGPKLGPPKLALQNWPSKIGSPELDLQKLRHTINEFSKNIRSIQKRCTCCWISQNQKQNSRKFSLRTIRWAIIVWRFWKNIQANNWTTKVIRRNCF